MNWIHIFGFSSTINVFLRGYNKTIDVEKSFNSPLTS